jgi:hypothetical protein
MSVRYGEGRLPQNRPTFHFIQHARSATKLSVEPALVARSCAVLIWTRMQQLNLLAQCTLNANTGIVFHIFSSTRTNRHALLSSRTSRPQRPLLLHGKRRRAHAQKVKLGRPPEPARRDLSNDLNDRAVVGASCVAPGSTRYPGSTSSAPNATTSARVAERTTSPRAYFRTAP